MKIAIILFNLGGPDQLSSVRPFLFNLFRDRAILRLPFLFRYPLAALVAMLRNIPAQRIYARIGGFSPLLANTKVQALALERALNEKGRRDAGTQAGENHTFSPIVPSSLSSLRPSYKCFISMRYWHPLSDAAAKEVRKFGPDEILYLPLYPQYSTTTTESSFADFDRALKKTGIACEPRRIQDYPALPGFIEAQAALIRPLYQELAKIAAGQGLQAPRLLFSAHGLPEKIAKTDRYPTQCGETVEALIKALQIKDLDAVLCYQSRVGPLKWIGPATEEEIAKAGKDQRRADHPGPFTAENAETLYEIDQLYRELATKNAVPFFARTPCVGAHPRFIEGLAGLVREALPLARPQIPDAA